MKIQGKEDIPFGVMNHSATILDNRVLLIGGGQSEEDPFNAMNVNNYYGGYCTNYFFAFNLCNPDELKLANM